jgi:hypothetical protein
MMFLGTARFVLNGWVETQYLASTFQFPYWGFEWVTVPNPFLLYCLYGLIGISALAIVFGFLYRFAAPIFFLSFTYSELMDKTYYLNHYYFVSLVAFLLIFVPANRYASLDLKLGFAKKTPTVSYWNVGIFKWQIGLLYIFAGIAKIHPEWLLEAKPLIFWLPAQSSIPIVGSLLDQNWVAYFFCWFGMLYDLTIPFFLSIRKTRLIAYFSVVVFHISTSLLFQIGMFPYVMIVATLVFFPADFHQQILRFMGIENESKIGNLPRVFIKPWVSYGLILFFGIQVLMPFRYLAYPGNLFWTEQGYRFSWRVMLMEKTGYVSFRILDDKGNRDYVSPSEHLLPAQEKQMSTQPDMILQFAHFLSKEYEKKGWEKPRVYADAFVALNGRLSSRFIDPEVDLTKESDNLSAKNWILPFQQ